MSKRSPQLLLEDIVESADKILLYTAGNPATTDSLLPRQPTHPARQSPAGFFVLSVKV